ncbi:retrovirus-related pol polyprotein from transposon TNT 1-94 [Tanacetum coccineum]
MIKKDYKGEYKKMKAKLALLEASASTSQSLKPFQSKNKCLVAEMFNWDEEEVFDDEETTQVKVLMALVDDELTVGKNHALNGEWIDITMRKVIILLFMDEDSDWQTYLKYIKIDLKFVEEERLNLILVPESQVLNKCLKLTEASTNLESSKELESKPLTPLPPLKNLQGASPSSESVSGPVTIYDTEPITSSVSTKVKNNDQESKIDELTKLVQMLMDEKINSTQKIQESKPVNPQSESSKSVSSSKMSQESKPNGKNTDSSKSVRPKPLQRPKLKSWVKHSKDHFRAPTAHDMEIIIKTCLMPLALKTHNDSFAFVHELMQEMHADLKYVESLEKEVDELESDKAKFSNMYDMFLQECVSNDVMCYYLHSLSDLDAHTELQCLYIHKVKECECLAQKLSKQTEFVSKEVYTELLRSFAKLEKHSISLELALQQCQEQKKSDTVCKEKASNVPICHVFHRPLILFQIVQLILFIVDSGCTKHMTGNLMLLCNFVEKYLGTVRFGNDQFAPILGYGDLVQGNIMINRVYYVEGLNHNLFLVGQFCDADLEVAFWKSTCFVRDLQGDDLLAGNCGSDLYTISLQETTSSTPICLMAKASPTQTWLWHQRLSYLNFDYINLLLKKDVVIGLPNMKYVKDQLCSSCEVSKAKRSSFKTKIVPSLKGRLNLLHIDLCGPMRVASINGKKYILVIVDDYSRYTWTLFLRSKDETLEVLKDFLTMIQRNLQALVISVRTDKGTEFLNKTLNAFFKEEGIEHQTSTPRTPKHNSVVERRYRTLVEAARTMLSTFKLPLFFWAEVITTACYTQNRSIIIPTHEKTAYHIINDMKPLIKHLYIFGCTCYQTRDGENLDKMKEKGDPCIPVGYSTQSKGFHVYKKRTRLIVESIHLRFNEIKEMLETSVANDTFGLVPQRQKASDYNNSDPVPQLHNISPSADTTVSSQQELDLLFGPLYDEFFNTEPSTPSNVHAEENNDNQAEDA